MSNLTGLTDTVSYYCSLQGVKKKTTKIFNFPLQSGRHSGLMVRVLNSRASGPGSSPGWGHRVVFLGKALYSHSASRHPGV